MTVREEVQQRIEQDPELIRLRKKIESGKATYADTAAYSNRAGKLLGEVFSRRLPEIPLEEREPLCVELLHDRYIDINAAVDTAQRFMDEALGIHIAPQHAPFDSERGHQIGSSLRDLSKPVETLQRRSRAATETATKAMHDDRMKAESKFRHRAGLDCRITRVAVNGCCPWCSKVAGRYVYGEEPEDIYRRHDNCDCTVTFENGRKRQDVWSKREWEAPKPGAGAGDPVVFTKEQAAAAGANEQVVLTKEQAKRLQTEKHLKVLTNDDESDRMELKIKHRMMNFYDEDFYNPYTSDEIEEELQSSPIGRYVSHWIEYDGYSIEMNYDKNAPKNLCGEIRDKRITVYPRNHDNAQEISETIIHEFAHEKFEWVDTQENEVNCRIYEYLHSHDTISKDQISEIVKFVKEEYSELPEGDLYGY